MKTIVLDWEAFEAEIKPQDLMDEYRRLLDIDLKGLVGGATDFLQACPGCAGGGSRPAFEKSGLNYVECESCGSVYASPRPGEAALARFFRQSEAARFWREKILPQTAPNRLSKVVRPRARWILDVVDEYFPMARRAVAVGYHNDLLVKELAGAQIRPFDIAVTNPVADIEFAGLDLPSVEVRPTDPEQGNELPAGDIILAFDILDRAADPQGLFEASARALPPGGLFLATTTLMSGFDLQTLWDRSKTIYPPERLNLFSVEGLTALYERFGFEALEFSTPGMFDVEIVKRAVKAAPEADWPRFISYLAKHRTGALNDFQEFLQKHRLSSHARIVLRKR